MPALTDYVRLSPFTLDELVDAVNSVLRGLPKLHMTARTVKFYIAKGLVPGPVGGPRGARYSMEHVLRVVANRCFPQRGRSLEEAREEMDRLLALDMGTAINAVQTMVSELSTPQDFAPPRPAMMQMASVIREQAAPINRSQPAMTVRRIPLRPGITLEVTEGVDLEAELDNLVSALHEAVQAKS
ncbi:MAG: helix-turn-helix domain-containing protein [Fimbriimonadaceae bacterium]|nr:helix-turn-helix domain-containing protein [Fimbriimonadaceae bacterium]